MHEANFELIEIPHVRQWARIRRHPPGGRCAGSATPRPTSNTLVIISGDSDFHRSCRNCAKTQAGDRWRQQSTSDLMVANWTNSFSTIDLVRESRRTAAKRDARETPAAQAFADEEVRRKENTSRARRKTIEMAVATMRWSRSGQRQRQIWASMLKEAIKRRTADFANRITVPHLRQPAGRSADAGLLEFGRDEK